MAIISVIIPTYRRAGLLCEALKSVLEQSSQDFEVIIVDDHSNDNGATEKAVRSFDDARFKYLYLSNSKGPGGARNAALLLCTGQYISFLDSDDILRPRKLELQSLILDENADVAMVYSDEYLMDETGRISAFPVRADRQPPLPSGHIAPDFFRESFIATMTVTLRRSVFEEMGGFDESLLYNEDDDLWFRIMLKYKVLCSDYIAGIRRLHDTNMSRDRTKITYYQLRCMDKYIKFYPEFIADNYGMVRSRIRSLLLSYIMEEIMMHRLPGLLVLRIYFQVARKLNALIKKSRLN